MISAMVAPPLRFNIAMTSSLLLAVRAAFGSPDSVAFRAALALQQRYSAGLESLFKEGRELLAAGSYPNARSRPTGSRTPSPTRRAGVAGIQAAVLVWSPRASLVLIRSRRARARASAASESKNHQPSMNCPCRMIM
jgi:hypothetical protein